MGSSCRTRAWTHGRMRSSQQIMSHRSSILKMVFSMPSCGMTTTTPKSHLITLQQSEILHYLASTGASLFFYSLEWMIARAANHGLLPTDVEVHLDSKIPCSALHWKVVFRAGAKPDPHGI